MADFYEAVEDEQKYTDVCDIRKKANRTNSNVFEAFSGLECPGKELHEWESSSKAYRDKFKKAKQCVQRRLTTMKRFPARSVANKTSRQKHIYPIQVAYTYGKDCLKKFATKKEQSAFEKSVNGLISKIAESQPNVANYFDEGSIEKSIRSRSDIDYVRAILDREYYDNEQLMIIDKMRNIGYNKLDNSDKELFLSILNEGFSRRNNMTENNLNNSDSDSDSDEDSDEESNNNISTSAINYSKSIRRNLKKRRQTTKKRNNNTINLNTLLQSDKFKITNDDKYDEMTKRIKEISKLYGDFLLVRTRVFLIEDTYKDAYLKPDILNTEVMDKLSGISGMALTKKTLKKGKINYKYTTQLELFNKRMRLGDNFLKLQKQLKGKLDEITNSIQTKLKSGNKNIDISLKSFYDDVLPTYLRNIVKKDISAINTNSKDKYKTDKSRLEELYTDKSPIKIMNKEIAEMEDEMARNLQQQTVLQRMLDNPIFASRKNVIESTRMRLEDLKKTADKLDREYLVKYREKTELIESVLNELNAKYYNPYILLDLLNEVIRVESEGKKIK
jgi:hypothetical protein